MTIGAETGAIGSLATSGDAPPARLDEQVEYFFAHHLVQALAAHQGEEEGANYLGMMDDYLAREMARRGGLGIGKQLLEQKGEEVKP